MTARHTTQGRGQILRLVPPRGHALPHSLEAERAVLGALMLVDPPSDLVDILVPEDFYRDAHGKLYELLMGRHEDGLPCEMIAVVEHVAKRIADPASCGDLSYISSLPDNVPSTENIEYYARIVRDHSRKRRLMTALAATYNSLECGGSTSEARATIEATITAPGMEEARGVESSGELMEGLYRSIRAEADGRLPSYLRAGIPDLDEDYDFNGISLRGPTLVIARSSMGKTTLANCLGLGVAAQGRQVCFVPTETSKQQRLEELTFAHAGVNMRLWKKMCQDRNDAYQRAIAARRDPRAAELPHEEAIERLMAKLTRSADAVSRMAIDICEQGWSVERVCAELRRKHRRGEVDMVIVDYLQDLSPSRLVGPNRSEQVAHASKTLKDLQGELGIPFVIFAQAKHTDEHPKAKGGNEWLIPQMGEVQWASQVYMDAEEVWTLYRRDYYADRYENVELPGRSGHLTVAFRKRRVGGTTTLHVPIDLTTKWIGGRR